MKQVSIAGLNVQAPWSEHIVNGEKSIETRFYELPNKHINQPIALIETPGPNGKFKARIIAIVYFSESFMYQNKKHFFKDVKKHLVTSGDFDWIPEKHKWGWPIKKIYVLQKPVEPPKPRGIVFASKCTIPLEVIPKKLRRLLAQ